MQKRLSLGSLFCIENIHLVISLEFSNQVFLSEIN